MQTDKKQIEEATADHRLTAARADHVERLLEGVEEWNRWRSQGSEQPCLVAADLAGADLAGADLSRADLRDADLSSADLSGADVSDADLGGADLFGSDLSRANLKMTSLAGAELSTARLVSADLYKADLTGAYMAEADLAGAYLAGAGLDRADLRGANLRGANLSETRLRAANLATADLAEANLSHADIEDAQLSQANLAAANLIGLRYGSFRSMQGNFFGVRGLDSAHGNALFVRDARDEDYIETLRRKVDQEPSPALRSLRRIAFRLWAMIDYGRSLGRVALYATILALSFGTLYAFDRSFDWGLLDQSGGPGSALSPFYFSIVTYTTLGFGDITPSNWVGEVVVVTEVILGYVTLGLLLSILANRVARRA